MDGFEMARRIHEDTDLSGVVVMMLTSCDLSNDAQRCRELGISRYLVKPVMQADLLDAILITLGLPRGNRRRNWWREVAQRHLAGRCWQAAACSWRRIIQSTAS
jgi:CheY-like chemotaxis protein